MNIRQATEADAARIAEIYNWYIVNTVATFEIAAVSSLEMEGRIQEKIAKYNWLIGEFNQEMIGYAYYGSFRSRTAYNHVVESTIYLAPENTGKGFGKVLYSNLIQSAQQQGFREMIGVIALPNPGSIVLHQKMGFEQAGVLNKVGYKFNKYIDVELWQKSLA